MKDDVFIGDLIVRYINGTSDICEILLVLSISNKYGDSIIEKHYANLCLTSSRRYIRASHVGFPSNSFVRIAELSDE